MIFGAITVHETCVMPSNSPTPYSAQDEQSAAPFGAALVSSILLGSAADYSAAATAASSGARLARSIFSLSATRKASSSDWSAFNRGSQWVW